MVSWFESIRKHTLTVVFGLLFLALASGLVWYLESGKARASVDVMAPSTEALAALSTIQKENDVLVTKLALLQQQLALIGTQAASSSATSDSNPESASSPPTVSAKSSTPTSGKINLKTASQAQLETLPGIGPSKAQAILAYQKSPGFKAAKDLMNVKGIGEKTFAKLAPLVTVE